MHFMKKLCVICVRTSAQCDFIVDRFYKLCKTFKKNFMAPFYGWGSTASRLEPLREGLLLFTTQFQEIPGTHFIDLGRIKD